MVTKYNYVENSKSEVAGFQILEGPWKDVIYTYGKVKFIEDKETDKLRLKFEYNIHENPSQVDTDSIEFVTAIGDILAIEVERNPSGYSGKNRENSPQKSNT
jgi:hypothetical protein